MHAPAPAHQQHLGALHEVGTPPRLDRPAMLAKDGEQDHQHRKDYRAGSGDSRMACMTLGSVGCCRASQSPAKKSATTPKGEQGRAASVRR